MCAARWRCDATRERMQERRERSSSSPLGKYAVERSAFNLPWRHMRELLPLPPSSTLLLANVDSRLLH